MCECGIKHGKGHVRVIAAHVRVHGCRYDVDGSHEFFSTTTDLLTMATGSQTVATHTLRWLLDAKIIDEFLHVDYLNEPNCVFTRRGWCRRAATARAVHQYGFWGYGESDSLPMPTQLPPQMQLPSVSTGCHTPQWLSKSGQHMGVEICGQQQQSLGR